jgi:periplasmic protein TonB
MSVTLRLLTFKLLPIAASLLLHAAACGAIMLAPGWVVPRESVIVAELVDPEPAVQPTPPKPDRRPLRLPKPIHTPAPRAESPAQRPEPPAPRPAPAPRPEPPAPQVDRKPSETAKLEPAPRPEAAAATPAPEPTSPATTEPAGPAAHGPVAPNDAPAASNAAEGLPTLPAPGAPTTPPSVAALPPDGGQHSAGVTQSAAPRGGYQVKPSYPSTARRAGIQGTTLLGVFVGADGRVGDVVVRESAGHPDLDAAAIDAVKRWRFEPGRRGNEPVSMWVLLPVQFKLR